MDLLIFCVLFNTFMNCFPVCDLLLLRQHWAWIYQENLCYYCRSIGAALLVRHFGMDDRAWQLLGIKLGGGEREAGWWRVSIILSRMWSYLWVRQNRQ